MNLFTAQWDGASPKTLIGPATPEALRELVRADAETRVGGQSFDVEGPDPDANGGAWKIRRFGSIEDGRYVLAPYPSSL